MIRAGLRALRLTVAFIAATLAILIFGGVMLLAGVPARLLRAIAQGAHDAGRASIDTLARWSAPRSPERAPSAALREAPADRGAEAAALSPTHRAPRPQAGPKRGSSSS